ncbi:unnamed protein product, partial [marine sediment metagenome]
IILHYYVEVSTAQFIGAIYWGRVLNQLHHPESEKTGIVYQVGLKGKDFHTEGRINTEPC